MDEQYWYSEEQAAEAAALKITVIRTYTDLGAVEPSPQGYSAADLAELQRAWRLQNDLEIEQDAVAVLLRMRRQMVALQQEVRRLESQLRATSPHRSIREWIEADWE